MFYVINLEVGQPGQANNSASIVKCVKERDFAVAKWWRRCSKRPNRNVTIVKRV